MTPDDPHHPHDSAVQSLIDRFSPGSRLETIELLPGSYSNFTHAITYRTFHGEVERVVLRRFNPQNGSMAFKARLEFTVYSWLRGRGIPVPQPIALDDVPEVLDLPGFVASFVPGRQVMWPDNPPTDPLRWARKSAEMLARIHAVPLGKLPSNFHDKNEAALYFRRGGTIPPYLRDHSQGPVIWEALERHLPVLIPAPPVLVHADYWAGNILWEDDEISAVIDWEEAGYGDPGVDVAYALMDFYLIGQLDAWAEFLRAYEAARGGPVPNLHFWALAAAARPIHRPEGWISEEPFISRHREFVQWALEGVQAG